MPVALLTAACTAAPVPDGGPGEPAHARAVRPANIRRVAGDLPPGYEVATTVHVSSPVGSWGLGPRWTADPPQCAELADPGRRRGAPMPPGPGRGVSGSGAGGIVYAVVVALPTGPVTEFPAPIPDCERWAVTDGHTIAGMRLVDAPRIDGAETVAMSGNATTAVEGGTEIVSRAHTFTAYLGDYYAFTTLITDPGSTQPPLPPQFAADLLAKTVSALRG